jgi:3-hydroxyacyl-CoA dehydrogenase
LSYADLADVDLAIEAVFEERAVKQSVLRRLDEVLAPGAILASNTSTLDLDQLAAATSRPADVVGLHFFSPAQVMRLLEVVRGRATAPDVLATALALARTIGKTAVVARVCDGFIGNRMIGAYLQQAGFLLDEGASPRRVDAVMERFGFAMGPFRMSDLAGNDIGWAIRKRHRIERPELRHSTTADRLCELGRFGQKTGAGWYDYPSPAEAIESPVVAAMIEQCRHEAGLPTRAMADDEIEQRLVYALVNEGARLLEEGIAARASDIDVVYLAGYGFPRWRGGPMFHADEQGLAEVIAAMQRFASMPQADAAFWQPAAMLRRLAADGGRFT